MLVQKKGGVLEFVHLRECLNGVLSRYMKNGEMPERSNGLPWKGSISERVSRVRIPLSPQAKITYRR